DIAGDISQRIKVAIEGATKVPDGASWEASVKITLNAGKELGTQYGYASVKISDCSMTTLMLPIQWTVKDIVDVSPTRLFLRCDENSSRSSGRIVISCDPGTRLEIRNIASSEAADEFDFEVSRLRDNVIAIGVVWNHQNSPGHRYNCISIQCSAPIDKSFDVPVSTFVRN
ncbi:MAG: hypothetical protein JSS02_23395, partial [Planctomycetes bacterium]|nr:hypothetical protein [Planctomycetota bacterium]